MLGVPGMNYSVLLLRSKDWATYALVFDPAYPDQLERPLVLDILQLMWDRGEADGYAQHMTGDPFADTPAHAVLLHAALGDFQVTHVPGRGRGADDRRLARAAPWPTRAGCRSSGRSGASPRSGRSRSTARRSSCGTPARATTAPPPLTNTAPDVGEDPHENPRATPAAREQKSAFLMPAGTVIEVCGTDPCHSAAYMP